MLEEKIKIKPLTQAQIIISLDRLTRFKPTEDKYLRVFKDILTSNLISPKFKKNQLELMDYSILTEFVETIFKHSLKTLNISFTGDFSINKKLLQYEKSVFRFDKNVQKLLENKIDFRAAISLLDSDNIPLNLRWLKSMLDGENQHQARLNSGFKFPVEKVIIAEGITEEILLPKFAKILGQDFDKLGINLISAGGKNQVVKLFYQYSDILKLPMYVLLDSDAKANYKEIMPKLRAHDRVHVIDNGEFEDILPHPLLKKTLNRYLRNFSSVQLSDLKKDIPMTKNLEELFRERGLEFKKAEFASLVCENISSLKDVSPEIEAIIKELNK